MQTGHRLNRRLTSTLLALVLVASAVATCLPVAAEAAEGQCTPVQSATHCQRAPVMDCCDESYPDAPALPGPTLSARPDETKGAAGLDASCGFAMIPPAPIEHLAALAPPHGFRSTDLTTLNSVLLI
jgi:hypothetical protein